ncbi:hypothetical protein GP486_008479, partial [Trichoglossum hirsutum]
MLRCIEEVDLLGNSTEPYGSLPPSYEESVSDVPPDYSCTDTLASNSKLESQHPAPPAYASDGHPASSSSSSSNTQPIFDDPLQSITIDFSNTYNVRQHKKKGGKKGGGGGGGKSAGGGKNSGGAGGNDDGDGDGDAGGETGGMNGDGNDGDDGGGGGD